MSTTGRGRGGTEPLVSGTHGCSPLDPPLPVVGGIILARLVASGFGTGYARVAPGTVASLVALVIGAILTWVSPILLIAASVLAVLGGLWAIYKARVVGDPGWVVVDEFAGQWITLLGVGWADPAELVAAFVLFRILDITKPGSIGWADRRRGAFGIMGDDVIAGVMGAVILFAAWPLW